MDLMEDCASCERLYTLVATKFKLTVLRSPELWTQAYCVGLVDLTNISTMYPIDIMALYRTMRSVECEGRFCLVAYSLDKHGMCLGIIHAPQSSTDSLPTEEDSSGDTTWRKGEQRACHYDEEVLAAITRQVSADRFYYDPEPNTNLGYIRSTNPREHPVFDLTAWLDALFRLKAYTVLGVWCYANAASPEKCLALEVATDRKEEVYACKRAEGGLTRIVVSIVGVIISCSLLWILSFTKRS